MRAARNEVPARLSLRDGWADPQASNPSKAWLRKSHAESAGSLEYTATRSPRFATQRAARHGADPTRSRTGILWPDGQLPEQWDQFAELIYAGVNGVMPGGQRSAPKIMIHIDRGGDIKGTKAFSTSWIPTGIPYYIIGSRLTWWHGSLNDCAPISISWRTSTARHHRVEAAYNWRRPIRRKPRRFRRPGGPAAVSRRGNRS